MLVSTAKGTVARNCLGNPNDGGELRLFTQIMKKFQKMRFLTSLTVVNWNQILFFHEATEKKTIKIILIRKVIAPPNKTYFLC